MSDLSQTKKCKSSDFVVFCRAVVPISHNETIFYNLSTPTPILKIMKYVSFLVCFKNIIVYTCCIMNVKKSIHYFVAMGHALCGWSVFKKSHVRLSFQICVSRDRGIVFLMTILLMLFCLFVFYLNWVHIPFWRFWPRFMVQEHIWSRTIRTFWSWTIHNLKEFS